MQKDGNVLHDWSRGQKNGQQNNVPSPKTQCSGWFSGFSENRGFEKYKSTALEAEISSCFSFIFRLEMKGPKRAKINHTRP